MKNWLKTVETKVLLAFAAVYLIWGTTYLAIRIGLEHIEPFMMASIRFLIAGVLLLAFSVYKREKLFDKNALNQLLLGAFMLTLGQAVLFWAEKYIPSGLAAVFTALLPICYLITDTRNHRNYFSSKLTLFSIFLGLLGTIILFKDEFSAPAGQSATMKIIASVAAVLACLCWAVGSLYYKYYQAGGALFRNVGWQLIGGMMVCFCVSFFNGEWQSFRFAAIPLTTWGVIVYLAIAGSIIAFSASYYLITVRPAAVVGTYAYINPIIAVILGYVVAGEAISVSQISGIVIILLAAYFANRVKFNVA